MTITMTLKRELETYEAHRQELVQSALGKWVLIRDDKVVGTFDTEDDAIGAGYREFGNVPFLVRQIMPFDGAAFFVSDYIAL